jgi:uncharacterized protein (TIGR02271 family)
MSGQESIVPGARVRGTDGFVGAIERLEHQAGDANGQPDTMLVRSDDGHWRYRIPLMVVSRASRGPFRSEVEVAIGRDDLAHYVAEELPETPPAFTDDPAGHGQWGSMGQPPDTVRLPLAVEDLVAHKRPVVRGTVHIHKGVETVEQHHEVPVYHEVVLVEHVPVSEYDGLPPQAPGEVIIPILEERLVVTKKTVIKEYLRVRKHLVTKRESVHDSVRRETVEVTERREGEAGSAVPLLQHDDPGHDDQARRRAGKRRRNARSPANR